MTKFLFVAACFLTVPAFAASNKASFKKTSATSPVTEANSMAASTSTSVNPMPTTGLQNFEPKGIRFSLFKPVLNMHLKTTNSNVSLDNTFGLSMGYAVLPYKQIGWTANGSYIEIITGGEKYGVVRADANIAYGFEKNLNVKGGLNLAKFIIPSDIRDEPNPNIGVQASLGLSVTKNIGIDAGYTWMKQTNTNQEIILSGLEIGLNGTF